MPKTENPQPKEEEKTPEKPKVKTKRLTTKAVWSEVGELRQSVVALDAKAASLAQMVEGLGLKIETSRALAPDVQGAQQMAALTSGVQSLNGNYLRQVDELANVRRGLAEVGARVDALAANTKLVEESCGELSIEVDGLKEHIDKASKKAEAIEASLGRLEGSLKRSFWITSLVAGAVVIAVVVIAMAML